MKFVSSPIGHEISAVLYGVDRKLLNDANFLKKVIIEGLKKDNFKIPDFCLIEVTNEEFLAGGMLCGKNYEDISNELKRFGYSKIWT